MQNKEPKFGWWIEIVTNKPKYTYYFGGFDSYWEIKSLKYKYIQDFKKKEIEIVNIQVLQCQPEELIAPVISRYKPSFEYQDKQLTITARATSA